MEQKQASEGSRIVEKSSWVTIIQRFAKSVVKLKKQRKMAGLTIYSFHIQLIMRGFLKTTALGLEQSLR